MTAEQFLEKFSGDFDDIVSRLKDENGDILAFKIDYLSHFEIILKYAIIQNNEAKIITKHLDNIIYDRNSSHPYYVFCDLCLVVANKYTCNSYVDRNELGCFINKEKVIKYCLDKNNIKNIEIYNIEFDKKFKITTTNLYIKEETGVLFSLGCYNAESITSEDLNLILLSKIASEIKKHEKNITNITKKYKRGLLRENNKINKILKNLSKEDRNIVEVMRNLENGKE